MKPSHESHTEEQRRTSAPRLIAEAIAYGSVGACVGWALGYGLRSIYHVPSGGFANFFVDLYPAVGIYLGLFTGIAGRLMEHRRRTWIDRAAYGGLALGALTPLGYLMLYLLSGRELDGDAVLLALLLCAFGCVAGAIICVIFGMAPAPRPTSPKGPERSP
jgi:membrane protein YqaA with SNARE-associated domain